MNKDVVKSVLFMLSGLAILPAQGQQLRNGLGDASTVTSPASMQPYGMNDPNQMTSRNNDVFTLHKHADDTLIGSSTFQTQEATISSSPALRTQVFTPTAPTAVTAPGYLTQTHYFSEFMTSTPAVMNTREISPASNLTTVLAPVYASQTPALHLNSAFSRHVGGSTFMEPGSSLTKNRWMNSR